MVFWGEKMGWKFWSNFFHHPFWEDILPANDTGYTGVYPKLTSPKTSEIDFFSKHHINADPCGVLTTWCDEGA